MLDCLDDIDSDMSAFHRIDKPRALPAERFFKLAVRLPAYGGALAVTMARRGDEQATQAESAAPAMVSDVLPTLPNGDTPPEVVAAMRRAAFARHHGVDPSSINYISTDELVVEMMR